MPCSALKVEQRFREISSVLSSSKNKPSKIAARKQVVELICLWIQYKFHWLFTPEGMLHIWNPKFKIISNLTLIIGIFPRNIPWWLPIWKKLINCVFHSILSRFQIKKTSVTRPCWRQGEIIYVQWMLKNQKVNTLETKAMLGHENYFSLYCGVLQIWGPLSLLSSKHWGLFTAVNCSEHEAHDSPASRFRDQETWRYEFIAPYVFMVSHLTDHT